MGLGGVLVCVWGLRGGVLVKRGSGAGGFFGR